MPALPALATAADLTDYGYDSVPAGMLDRASVRVRRYTGQQITAGSSVVTLPGPSYHLPQRPVNEVTSVQTLDGGDVEYELCYGGYVRPRFKRFHPIVVGYNHGYDTLPDAVIEVVCSVAARMSATPAAVGSGAQTEQAGGESVTWGSDAYAGTTGLTRAERKELDRLFPRIPKTVRLL